MSIDGTGYFSSSKIHCSSCCVKEHYDGKKTYYHQMLGAVIVHPGYKAVIPLPVEPIKKQDGKTKNDCEQNAAIRLLNEIRREHPHLKIIIVEDALSSTGPHIGLLKQLKMKFIIGAKQYAAQFKYMNEADFNMYSFTDEEGTTHNFKYVNDIALNGSHPDLKVNLLDYQSVDKKGNKHHFTWVTDLILTKSSVYKIMRGGRARWKIENETFNTLKNQGYHFEHNYGHGYKYLSTIFAHLMLLAFLIDQVQQLCCKLFKSAMSQAKSRTLFWQKVRGLFFSYFIKSWEDLYHAISHKKGMVLAFNTS